LKISGIRSRLPTLGNSEDQQPGAARAVPWTRHLQPTAEQTVARVPTEAPVEVASQDEEPANLVIPMPIANHVIIEYEGRLIEYICM
jgi:hypothetical protein